MEIQILRMRSKDDFYFQSMNKWIKDDTLQNPYYVQITMCWLELLVGDSDVARLKLPECSATWFIIWTGSRRGWRSSSPCFDMYSYNIYIGCDVTHCCCCSCNSKEQDMMAAGCWSVVDQVLLPSVEGETRRKDRMTRKQAQCCSL